MKAKTRRATLTAPQPIVPPLHAKITGNCTQPFGKTETFVTVLESVAPPLPFSGSTVFIKKNHFCDDRPSLTHIPWFGDDDREDLVSDVFDIKGRQKLIEEGPIYKQEYDDRRADRILRLAIEEGYLPTSANIPVKRDLERERRTAKKKARKKAKKKKEKEKENKNKGVVGSKSKTTTTIKKEQNRDEGKGSKGKVGSAGSEKKRKMGGCMVQDIIVINSSSDDSDQRDSDDDSSEDVDCARSESPGGDDESSSGDESSDESSDDSDDLSVDWDDISSFYDVFACLENAAGIKKKKLVRRYKIISKQIMEEINLMPFETDAVKSISSSSVTSASSSSNAPSKNVSSNSSSSDSLIPRNKTGESYTEIMDSYRNLFCRRCFRYDCNIHFIVQRPPQDFMTTQAMRMEEGGEWLHDPRVKEKEEAFWAKRKKQKIQVRWEKGGRERGREAAERSDATAVVERGSRARTCSLVRSFARSLVRLFVTPLRACRHVRITNTRAVCACSTLRTSLRANVCYGRPFAQSFLPGAGSRGQIQRHRRNHHQLALLGTPALSLIAPPMFPLAVPPHPCLCIPLNPPFACEHS